MDRYGWARPFVLAAALVVFAGCGEDSAAPASLDGSGIRVLLPPEAEGWDTVTIELRSQNPVSPPTCGGAPSPGLVPGSVPAEDICTRKSVEIWDLLGERVLYLPDVPYPRVPWDTRDDQGEFVSPGVYSTHEECLDSQGPHVFDGTYYVTGPEHDGICEWILWTGTYDPALSGRSIEIEPVPTEYAGYFAYFEENQTVPSSKLVTFDSPYLLIVRAPDGREVRRAAILVEGAYIEIRADFASANISSEE